MITNYDTIDRVLEDLIGQPAHVRYYALRGLYLMLEAHQGLAEDTKTKVTDKAKILSAKVYNLLSEALDEFNEEN